MVVKWRNAIEAGSINRSPGPVIDIVPTLCELAGATYPLRYERSDFIPVEGKSVVRLFQGRSREPHEALFWEHIGNKAVRAVLVDSPEDWPY